MQSKLQNAVERLLAEAWITPQQKSRVAEVNSLLMQAGNLLPQVDDLKNKKRFEAKARNHVRSISHLAASLEAFDLGDAVMRTSTKGDVLQTLISDSQALVAELRSECQQFLSEIARREPVAGRLEQRAKRLNTADRDIAKFLIESLKDDIQDALHRLKQQFKELQLVDNTLMSIDKTWSNSPDECVNVITHRLSLWTASWPRILS